jgi:methyl coenzyme M reductase beta subunit
LSGVGDSLHISNQAIHHAVLILDLYATREVKDFDIWLAALGALLVSAKFVQMKYPSADSLNSATDNSYTYNDIIQQEGHLLSVISWELL